MFQLGADAPILLVSQAPGTAAHRSGMPFDDPSGDRLRRWLGVMVDAASIRITQSLLDRADLLGL